MTASEFAFLAIGLVLGILSGAALIEVLRARPPASREVRVTVAPNAIQGRLAATLADPASATDAPGPARFGPGDRRLGDDRPAVGEPVGRARRVEDLHDAPRPLRAVGDRTSVPSPGSDRPPGVAAAAGAVAVAEPPARARPDPARPTPLRLRPTAATVGGPSLVAVPMSLEPDPITAELRATAAAATADARAAGATVAGTDAGEADTAESGEPARAAARAAARSAANASPAPTPTDDGPCAEERRVADERCAVAARAREGATAAAEHLRRQQRAYDELVSRAETAAAAADPRAVRAAKEQAQHRFRAARAAAGTRDDVEAGARAWLAEINQINHVTREASVAAERDRAAAAQLGPALERLSVETDAARIASERAEEACVAAREAVAACDESNRLAAAAAAAAGSAATSTPPAEEAPARIAAAMPEPEDEFEFSSPMRSSGGEDASILRILRGDRAAFDGAVARLAGDDPEARRMWQARIGGLADALVARSIEATAFDFPVEHPFWGPFNQSQNRDIAAGLSSLGFRFDGYGGWLDERVPGQRDLSLAVGYAGLDPMRIRHWPSEAEMRDLLRDVRVAADEYVAGAAGGMSLGELVTLLGRRADPLTDLWNEWGAVRPILLEAS